MAEYLIQSETLNAIANAINAKTDGTSAMTPAQMAAAIADITTGDNIDHAEDGWHSDGHVYENKHLTTSYVAPSEGE